MRSVDLLLVLKLELSNSDINGRANTIFHLKSTTKGPYKTTVLGSNFDGNTGAIKLGIISICPVVLSYYTSPTDSRCAGRLSAAFKVTGHIPI